MEIVINTEGQSPLFAQLVDQIKQRVLDKSLVPGAALPPIRQLANDLQLNNKTVAKAYQLLERDQIIQTKGYRGTFVHPDAIANCTNDLAAWAFAQLAETIETLRGAGTTDSEIRIAFADAMHNRQTKEN
ncbi:MAG: GntR family transcriptional regulator [Robiginitomaculum sp.]|nr:MAG: GntR family transcriptional regulator [Robiginitomaculum sp.]